MALLMQRGIELIKVSRPGFWPTHLWFFLLPLGLRDMFGHPAFWVGCIYVCFPLGLLLYGWNDVGDAATDALNPRKDSWLFGARPSAWMRSRLPLFIAIVQVPFLLLFIWFAGIHGLLWFALVGIANLLYNGPGSWLISRGVPNWAFKRVAGLDLLNQVGYLLVFLLASWICNVPQLAWSVMVFSGLFAMHSHMFGQLMDIDQDREAGRQSTAVRIGMRSGKALLTTMLLAEAVIAAVAFRGWFVAPFMAAGALFFLFDTLLGPNRYPMWFTKLFFVGWNLVVLGSMHFVWRYGVFVNLV